MASPGPDASLLYMPATQTHPRTGIPLRQLRDELAGRIIAPGDPDYDEARAVFRGDVDRRPAVVARVADAFDASRVVSFAREQELELAVCGGGHSGAGHGVVEGGVVLDLSAMRGLDIDLNARTAWAEAGTTTGAYTAAAAGCGLATGFGDTGSVGIGGITLGGGIGLLVRKHGLTIDDLLAAELVTADGRILRVDEASHPDLYWAIRGGGGNFGVATRLQFRLHELRGILGGMLFLPATPAVIAGFVAAVKAAPEELSAIANIMPAPPVPFLPEAVHGRLVVMIRLAFAGGAGAGQRAVAPLRDLGEPIADLIRPMSYPEVFPPEREGPPPVTAARTMFVDEIDPAAAERIVVGLDAAQAPMAIAQLRVLGGAAARVPADATAFAHRDRAVLVNLAAVYDEPAERPVHEAWVRQLASALTQGEPGAYANFLGDEGEDRVREAYPGSTWDRLARIKARYDPTNLFHLNQNVPPANGDER